MHADPLITSPGKLQAVHNPSVVYRLNFNLITARVEKVELT